MTNRGDYRIRDVELVMLLAQDWRSASQLSEYAAVHVTTIHGKTFGGAA